MDRLTTGKSDVGQETFLTTVHPLPSLPQPPTVMQTIPTLQMTPKPSDEPVTQTTENIGIRPSTVTTADIVPGEYLRIFS